MHETILQINEFFDRHLVSENLQQTLTYDGFEIITNEQTILLAIDNINQCCEDVGYFMTNDNVNDFIGAQLHSIDYVDGELKVHKVQKKIFDLAGQYVNYQYDEYYVDMKRSVQLQDSNNYALFVNLHTSRGKLQFVAYNAGNGYYGHDFRLISEQHNYCTSV